MLGQQVRISSHLSKYVLEAVRSGEEDTRGQTWDRVESRCWQSMLGEGPAGSTFMAKRPPSPIYLA